jgi:hypothetical protein
VDILLPRQPPKLIARSGWEIPQAHVETQDSRLVRIRAEDLVVQQAKKTRRITIRSVSPYPYNCVGMIFAARRAWIEIYHIYDVLREDGYQRVQPDHLMAGDIVLYKDNKGDPAHVALIIEIERTLSMNIRVMSKWGKDAEFIHLINDVPENLGKPVEYYTERER